jgi:hypothetical protein
MDDPEPPPVIIPEATAKRRLAIYTLVRLLGFAALFAAVALGQGGVGVASVVLLLIGAASLFLRPRLLGKILGDRW